MMLLSEPDHEMTATTRFHAPNVMPIKEIGINGAPGAIQIAMLPGKRYTTLYLSATALDAAGKESPQVAAPFELKVVNPPPVVTPAAPYPASDGAGALYGEVSLPNHDAQSTVHLAWAAIHPPGSAGEGVRYELARALDSSILASERDRWRRGGTADDYADLGIVVEPETIGHLQPGFSVDPARGTFQVKTKPLGEARLEGLVGRSGRIRIAHTFAHPNGQDAYSKEVWHRLIKAVPSPGLAKALILLCQPFDELDETSLGEIADDAAFEAQATPDYSALLGKEDQEDRLRQLADARYTRAEPDMLGEGRNESAFGIVTGVPIAGTDFVDTIPGIGRSRFFYKLRAVFPGEVRSAWSPASVAFRQLDLSPAEAPEVIQVRRAPTVITVTLARPAGPGVRGIRLFSQIAGAAPVKLATFAFEPGEGELPLPLAPLRPAGKLLDLRRVLAEARARLGADLDVTGIYDRAVDRESLPPDGDLSAGARSVGDIFELADARDFEQSVILRVLSNTGCKWLDHVASQVEIRFDAETVTAGDLLVQTLKENTLHGRTIHLDSIPVRLGGTP
jgi:hypothetical protein